MAQNDSGMSKQKMKKIVLTLGLITLLAGMLRIGKLGEYPVSLSLDEVVIGYDAYSILKTGKDQHGNPWPLAFRSIGDYKAPTLIYLMVPAIATFGLTEFGTRITIALIGTLTPLLVFLLTDELLEGVKEKKLIGLATALSVAISPWHIKFSRSTFEAILALFLMILGVWLFLRLSRLKSRWFWLSAVVLVAAAYSYHAERVVVPLLGLGLLVIFRKKINRSWLIAGVIAGLPLLYLMLSPAGKTRAVNGLIARDVEINKEYEAAGMEKPAVLGNFWLKRYLDYWDLSYLFINGAELTSVKNPGVGLFYLMEVVPFGVGLWLVWIKGIKGWKKDKRKLWIWWLLVGPMAASVANNAQHPLRSLTWIPMLQIIVGVGVAELWKRWQWKLVIVGGMVGVVSLTYWNDIYFRQFPREQSEYWQYGMKETAKWAWENQDKYKEIVFDPVFGSEGPFNFGIPYAYVLFYGKYEPTKFQTAERRRIKTEDSVDFENFSFRSTYWPDDRKSNNKVFIASPWSIPEGDIANPNQIKKKIYFKNGKLAFVIVESEKQ